MIARACTAALTLAVAATTAGCAAPGPVAPAAPPPRVLPVSPAGIDRAVIAAELVVLQDLADRACACTDAACEASVDAAWTEANQTATMNDPVVDVETWPDDLDALGNYEVARMAACMTAARYSPSAPAVMMVRRIAAFREHACACEDAACASRVWTVFRDFVHTLERSSTPVSEAQRQTLRTDSEALGRCVRAQQNAQLMLDLRGLRAAACACADPACAADVQDSLDRWVETVRDIKTDDPGQKDVATELANELLACLARARGDD